MKEHVMVPTLNPRISLRGFVEALFEHESAEPELSDADIEHKIAALNADLGKLEALLEQRKKDAEEEAKERAEAEKKAKLALVEAAEKEVAQATLKLASVKTQVGTID
jgi:SMC interacting uncharacterized protein involved in chromosome segregation